MKKQKMFGIGNKRTFNYYIFEKTLKSIKSIEDILSEFDIFLRYDILPPEKKEADKVKLKRLTDVHNSNLGNSNLRVDLFFGKEKVFLTAVCSQKTRGKLNEAIFEQFELVEPKDTIKFRRPGT